MKLKPTIKGMKSLQVAKKEEPEKKQRKSQKNTLPKDEYKPEFPPIRFLVRETPSTKNPSQFTRQYLEISVRRFNDELGLPYVWIQRYQESPVYTGYLKGKSVYFPLEMFEEFMSHMCDVDMECLKRKIE